MPLCRDLLDAAVDKGLSLQIMIRARTPSSCRQRGNHRPITRFSALRSWRSFFFNFQNILYSNIQTFPFKFVTGSVSNLIVK